MVYIYVCMCARAGVVVRMNERMNESSRRVSSEGDAREAFGRSRGTRSFARDASFARAFARVGRARRGGARCG